MSVSSARAQGIVFVREISDEEYTQVSKEQEDRQRARTNTGANQ
jgi:hypothetical protein